MTLFHRTISPPLSIYYRLNLIQSLVKNKISFSCLMVSHCLNPNEHQTVQDWHIYPSREQGKEEGKNRLYRESLTCDLIREKRVW